MSKIEYKTIGSYIREQRVQLKMPLRKLAAELDIDTSTLSKIEKGERQANLEMIPVLAKVFKIDFKNLQIRFLSDKLVNDYEKEEFVVEALKEAINKIDNIVNAANL
ncbi:MAG: helix-turn-helix transcriptional regulator [Bacteroidota bacterium]